MPLLARDRWQADVTPLERNHMKLRLYAAPLVAAAVATLSLASPATAAPSGHGAPVVGAAPRASAPVVRTLTQAEIQARGLTPYAGSTTKRVSSKLSTASAPAPRKLVRKVSRNAGGCWTSNIKQPGWLGMDGYGSEDWCGNGSTITYAAAACWGTDGWYPTYNYLGCSTNKYYGVGWNVADTQYNWDMCIAWWGGGCAKHRHLWDRYRFGASGGVWLISHGG